MFAKTLVLALSSVAFAGSALAAPARGIDEASPAHVITVQGSGEIDVVPDEVVIVLDINQFDPKLAVAKRTNDAAVERILAIAARYGIPKQDIQTAQMSMQIVREARRNGEYEDEQLRRSRPVIGYLVGRQMHLRLGDPGRLEALHTDLLESGDCEIDSVAVGVSQPRRHRDAARDMAVRAAREKADAMAAALGQRAGKAISITENADAPVYNTSNASMNSFGFAAGDAGGGDSGRFAPGQVKIKASVTIVFALD